MNNRTKSTLNMWTIDRIIELCVKYCGNAGVNRYKTSDVKKWLEKWWGTKKVIDTELKTRSFDKNVTSDSISRQAATDAVLSGIQYDKYWSEQIKRAEMQWIPVSERLPEVGRSILFTSDQGFVAEGEYKGFRFHRVWHQYRFSATLWDDEVIAWMPLPEPWRRGKNEINWCRRAT